MGFEGITMHCNVCGKLHPEFESPMGGDFVLFPEGYLENYVCEECKEAGRKVCSKCGNIYIGGQFKYNGKWFGICSRCVCEMKIPPTFPRGL